MDTIKGSLLLAGGAEFRGEMAALDRQAMYRAGGVEARIDIIPAAAAPDHNHIRAGENGVNWFTSLGAHKVVNRMLIDHESAQDTMLADDLEKSQFLYLLGGFPGHLAGSLRNTLCFKAMLGAYQNGAVLGGSSAGAMVLGQYFYNPQSGKIESGLDLLPNLCIIPHFGKFASSWIRQIRAQLQDIQVLGIDEETGILSNPEAGDWTVHGKGKVYLLGTKIREYGNGSTIPRERMATPRIP